MSDELKVVITLKGERGLIGIQSPGCDPQIHTFEGDLAHALESVPELVEEAKARWADNPRNPKCETPLPSQAQAAAPMQAQRATATPRQQPSMF